MDDVFGALNDPTRRALLDALHRSDGQTLGELCELAPEMTRFGVMNHLRVLEEAGLVTTKKVGRSKHHYLNPVPIRLVTDRWISKYTEPLVDRLVGLKAHLEGDTMSKPDHIHQIYINRPQDVVWNAIVDGDVTVQYFYGTRVESKWAVGDSVQYFYPDGSMVADGEVITIDPGTEVTLTFLPMWDPELEAEGPVRTTWRLDEENGQTRVTVEYYDMPEGTKQHVAFATGIVWIASEMKRILES